MAHPARLLQHAALVLALAAHGEAVPAGESGHRKAEVGIAIIVEPVTSVSLPNGSTFRIVPTSRRTRYAEIPFTVATNWTVEVHIADALSGKEIGPGTSGVALRRGRAAGPRSARALPYDVVIHSLKPVDDGRVRLAGDARSVILDRGTFNGVIEVRPQSSRDPPGRGIFLGELELRLRESAGREKTP